MKKRSLLASVLPVGAAVLLLAAGEAAAQFDHLTCYKIKDPHNFSAGVNTQPFQVPPFAAANGCKLLVRGQEFCIPTDKTRLPGSTAPSAPIVGQNLQNDFLCYKMRCPVPMAPVSGLLVSDQFGSRPIAAYKIARLCTPAVKGPPPTTTTSTTTTSTTTTTLVPCQLGVGVGGALQCGGSCPNATDTCLWDSIATTCVCLPQTSGCSQQAPSTCGAGLCTTPGESCQYLAPTCQCF